MPIIANTVLDQALCVPSFWTSGLVARALFELRGILFHSVRAAVRDNPRYGEHAVLARRVALIPLAPRIASVALSIRPQTLPAGMARGYLNSNNKVKLLDGSLERTKKGYEEIHIPEPKPRPAIPGDLVEISRLPTWAHDAFSGMPTPNRIQSRLYPVAFGQDDIILLCAPTGAGKVCR
ncbi:DEIH-box ATPase [Ceratobasidium sp. 428]|nr:DEIH-box ATPase [Ceratobasidium sp. 428]